ncbi:MAG TPA: TonB-dependent receptor, partial [Blastocatellia bacterium]|nr:TonB-dependent receptor [Blastocatellia bacterium]
DGKPLTDFHREQFGGTIGGPIVKSKVFYFGAFEQILANLTRANLSQPIGTPCSVSAPTITANESLINSSDDCARLALIGFIKAKLGQDEGLPVKHPIRNSAFLTKLDWTLNPSNQLGLSYNFDYSKNENQTFDVSTYGTSANGTEGPSKINNVNLNLNTTFSPTKLNEAHFSYSRESRPRSATPSNLHADTAMGFVTTFRFGDPFFLNPNIDELLWRTHLKDNFSIIAGRHTWKMGGEWLHTLNDQVFRGFFTGRYIFDSVTGFLKYASTGPGFGPSANAAHLLLFLQGAGRNGPATDAAGASRIANQDYSLFAQDKWQVRPNLTFNYGLRWEAQIFPKPVVPPNQTAYGIFLSDPRFPSNGTLPNQKKMFQPRVGFAWDVLGNSKSLLRASWGIYNARQNMLSQVGSITTNGVQQQTIAGGVFATPTILPVWPGLVTPTAQSCGSNPFPCFSGVRVFSRDYANPRIYTTNVGFEQELAPNWAFYADFTHAKGVHLTRFLNFNRKVDSKGNPIFGPQLGEVMVASSPGKSLYRGLTLGIRKRFSHRFQLEGNYVLSKDKDDDSNERDPFTDRAFDINNLSLDYALSDRDIRHKFNFYSYSEIWWGLQLNTRIQTRTAQPITPGTRTANNRNTARKDNEYFSFDWRLTRPMKFGERISLLPMFEMFNTFNNKNNVNPLTTPGLFNFDGFLRVGVGDPRTVQLALKLAF